MLKYLLVTKLGNPALDLLWSSLNNLKQKKFYLTRILLKELEILYYQKSAPSTTYNYFKIFSTQLNLNHYYLRSPN